MTTLLVFTYAGGEEGRRGIQRGRSGDECYDDELGKCILDKVNGAHVLAEFGASGEAKRIERRPCAGVYVIKNREALPAPVPTGRSAKSSSASISSFFIGPSATPPPQAAKPRAARGGAFKAPSGGRGAISGGRGRGGSESGARGASSSSGTPTTAGAKAASKRLMPEAPEATTMSSDMGNEEDEEDAAEQRKRAKPAAFELGAEHAEEQSEEEAGSSKASAKAPAR